MLRLRRECSLVSAIFREIFRDSHIITIEYRAPFAGTSQRMSGSWLVTYIPHTGSSNMLYGARHFAECPMNSKKWWFGLPKSATLNDFNNVT